MGTPITLPLQSRYRIYVFPLKVYSYLFIISCFKILPTLVPVLKLALLINESEFTIILYKWNNTVYTFWLL